MQQIMDDLLRLSIAIGKEDDTFHTPALEEAYVLLVDQVIPALTVAIEERQERAGQEKTRQRLLAHSMRVEP